uniref:Endo-xylogalacturonan hydrolase-like protein n=1 Tax=Adineta vaga TaxID=104782 RepID=B3G4R3_ADIVA|nr:endo-xylogalacturonan hydrolase-like protein [Adineta vaga]
MMIMDITILLWLVLLVLNGIFCQVITLTKQDPCTPLSAGNSSIDDVPAISQALITCGNGGTIIIRAGEIFMIRSPLDFRNCIGCNFQIEGTLKVLDDIDYWEGKTAFFLMTNVVGGTFHSLTGSGLIDGSGQAFWDYFAINKTYERPLLIQFSNSSNIIFTKIKLIDPAFWFIFITNNSMNIKLSDLVLSAVSTSQNRPKNTDGFDTGECSHISISNIHVTNGDDCVSFKYGSDYITVNNITCIGSHGLSVGSLGMKPDHPYTVKNIYVSNAKMINSTTATRIKFFPGGPSHGTVIVRNVTFKDVIVDNCDYALQVDNCYESNVTTCKEYPSAAELSNIRFININGKTSKKYDPNIAKINCPPSGTCDITFIQWDIVAPSGNSTVLCSDYHNPSGIICKGATSSASFLFRNSFLLILILRVGVSILMLPHPPSHPQGFSLFLFILYCCFLFYFFLSRKTYTNFMFI